MFPQPPRERNRTAECAGAGGHIPAGRGRRRRRRRKGDGSGVHSSPSGNQWESPYCATGWGGGLNDYWECPKGGV